MKQNILKTFRRLCVPALVLGAFFASCTDELSSEVVPGGGGKGGETEVTLKLQVPSVAAAGKTRAVNAEEESLINDLYVLAFKKEGNAETFDYYVAARKIDDPDKNGNAEWTANLKVTGYAQTFVMIANAQETNSRVNEQISALAGTSVGQKKMEVLARLTETLDENEKEKGFRADNTGAANHHPFTMYGQTAETTIGSATGTSLSVSMHRIMARVQVLFTGNAAEDATFKPESVSLYNFNDRARVIPDDLDETKKGEYEKEPTLPENPKPVLLPVTVDGKEKVPTYPVGDDKKIEHEIYLFETAQPTEGSDTEKHLKRPCLIVKGKYQGADESCYYRVDFYGKGTTDNKTEKYWDVIRNHTYNVTLSGVTGAGHNTAEEALKAKKANITATVVRWNDQDIADIDFDGTHVLGIGTMKYELGRKGSKDGPLPQTVKASKGLKWTAQLYATDENGNVDVNTQPDWIDFIDEQGSKVKVLSKTGNDDLQDLGFEVQQIGPTPAERRAVMRFTAKNLQVDALVAQDQSEPVYIIVKSKKTGEIITEAEFDESGGDCEDMIIEFGPAQTELSWKAYSSNGINLTNAAVNGTPQGKLDGIVSANDNEDGQSIEWKASAGAIQSASDFVNAAGVLTLIAKGPKGVQSKAIKLVQRKYGVRLNTNMIVRTGDTETIQVAGNMNWVVEPVRTNDLDGGDPGYDQAVAEGYIREYNKAETGFPTDEFDGSWGLNHVSFETLTSTETGQQPIEIKLRFTDKEKNKSIIKALTIAPGFIYNNAVYALWGPVDLTVSQYNEYEYKPANLPANYYRINQSQAQQLVRDGYATELGHDRTKVIKRYVVTGMGATDHPIEANTDGTTKKLLDHRSPGQDYHSFLIKAQWIYTGTAKELGWGARVIVDGRAANFGYKGYGYQIYTTTTSYVERIYKDAAKTDLICIAHPNVNVTFYAGGQWNNINGCINGYIMTTPNPSISWDASQKLGGAGAWWFGFDRTTTDAQGKKLHYYPYDWYANYVGWGPNFGNITTRPYVQFHDMATIAIYDDIKNVYTLPTYYLKKIKDLGQ